MTTLPPSLLEPEADADTFAAWAHLDLSVVEREIAAGHLPGESRGAFWFVSMDTLAEPFLPPRPPEPVRPTVWIVATWLLLAVLIGGLGYALGFRFKNYSMFAALVASLGIKLIWLDARWGLYGRPLKAWRDAADAARARAKEQGAKAWRDAVQARLHAYRTEAPAYQQDGGATIPSTDDEAVAEQARASAPLVPRLLPQAPPNYWDGYFGGFPNRNQQLPEMRAVTFAQLANVYESKIVQEIEAGRLPGRIGPDGAWLDPQGLLDAFSVPELVASPEPRIQRIQRGFWVGAGLIVGVGGIAYLSGQEGVTAGAMFIGMLLYFVADYVLGIWRSEGVVNAWREEYHADYDARVVGTAHRWREAYEAAQDESG